MRELFLVWLILSGTALAGNKKMPELKRNENGLAYRLVCIEGYRYIYIWDGYRGYLAPKFNDNREPQKCNQRKNYGKRLERGQSVIIP